MSNQHHENPPNRAIMTIVAPFSTQQDLQQGLSALGLADTGQLAKKWDWRDHVKLLPPDNQMKCGNCWAHATTNTLTDKILCMTHDKSNPVTGLHLNPLATTICTFSEYQGVEARCPDGSIASNCQCGGGMPYVAGKWFEQYGAIPSTNPDGSDIRGCPPSWEKWCSESNGCAGLPNTQMACSDFPNCNTKRYKAEPNSTVCVAVQNEAGVIDPEQTIHNIKTQILLTGPVTATFWVMDDFMNYYTFGRKGGVYISNSDRKVGGHAVEVVGWDTTGDVPYWIVKNSWGTSWNGDGYWNHAMYPHNKQCALDVPVQYNPYTGNGGITNFKAIVHGVEGKLGTAETGGSPSKTSKTMLWVAGGIMGAILLFILIMYFVKRRQNYIYEY